MNTKKLKGILIGDYEVPGTVDNLWIDTSNPKKVATKVFVNGEWKTSGGGASADDITPGNLITVDADGKLVDANKSTSDFVETPETAGTSGQLLSTNAQGETEWINPNYVEAPSTAGTEGQILKMGSDGPVWGNAPAGSVMDDAMSDISENPVQNKVIKNYVDGKVTQTTGDSTEAVMSQKACTDAFLKKGDYDASTAVGLADNLKSWEGADNLTVDDIQSTIIFTTGGNESIDSSITAHLKSIVAKTDVIFSSPKLVASGFNLLRLASNSGIATAITDGYYFPVPALPFGTINTAQQPNGILFTDNEGTNLTPTVRFSTTVPTAITDGDVCTYHDENGYRFYTTSQQGYIIVSGITWENTCAHIAWSKRYDEFISPTDAGDAGSTIDISSVISALHDYNMMLVVGNSADKIIKYSDTQFQWKRQVDRIKPTWTNTLQEDNTTYLHTATISGMKDGGAAVFMSGTQALTISGNTVSYTDSNSTALDIYVKYELATPVTGEVTLSSALNVEDWGIIAILGATGEIYTTITYGQNIPDSLRALVSAKMSIQMRVIAEALVQLYNENRGLKALINDPTRRIDAAEYRSCGFPMMLSAAGAPNDSVVPNEWNTEMMGVWTGVPMVPGQEYFDTTNNKWYKAKKNLSGATGDWLLLN